MSKAVEKAYKTYPLTEDNRLNHERNAKRLGFQQGYEQAEKDLALTWEDIKIVLDIEIDILRECNSHKELVIETYPKGEDYYGEILKRFKERKEK